jgi:hypothetical protein
MFYMDFEHHLRIAGRSPAAPGLLIATTDDRAVHVRAHRVSGYTFFTRMWTCGLSWDGGYCDTGRWLAVDSKPMFDRRR